MAIYLPLVYLLTSFKHTPQIRIRSQSQQQLQARSWLPTHEGWKPNLVTALTDAAAEFLEVTICFGISSFMYSTVQFNLSL